MDFEAAGIIDIVSHVSVSETADKLVAAFEAHRLRVFGRIDQQAAAKSAGVEMRPMELILFGNPAAGTPLMIANPSIAIDLPLKALVWEDEAGNVRVGYNSPAYLQRRHGLPDLPFVPIGTLIEKAIA